MTTPPEARADARDETLIAEWRSPSGSRCTLHTTDRPGVAHLRRHRTSAWPPYDTVATITHAGGVVSQIQWDRLHSRPDYEAWRAPAETWVRGRIAEEWAR